MSSFGTVRIPTARQLRRHVRLLSRARNPRSTGGRLGALYEKLLYVVVLGGIVLGPITSGLVSVGELNLAAVDLAFLRWFALLSALMSAAGVTKLALAFGPVRASSEDQTWLLSTPVGRRPFLLPTYIRLLSLGGLLGAAVAAALAVLVRVGLLSCGLLGCVAGMLVIATAVLVQSLPHMRAHVQRFLSVALAIGVLASSTLAMAKTNGVLLSAPDHDLLFSEVAFGLTAVAVVVVVQSRLAFLDRAVLAHGAEVTTAAATAFTFLDLTLLSATLMTRRVRAIGRVSSVRLRGSRTRVLLRAEAVRLVRFWRSTLVWGLLIATPYIACAFLPTTAVAVAHLVAATLATDRLANGLRMVSRAATLRRLLGGSDARLRLTHMVVPCLGAGLWCVLTSMSLVHNVVLCSALSGFGAMAVTYRMATRPEVDYVSPMLDTPFGSIPVNTLRQLGRGPLLLASLAVVQVFIAG